MRTHRIHSSGDYSYAELDAIRARKARERAKRFGLTGQEEEVMDDEMGLLPGGIKETRIGAVGPTQQQMGNITPEASAHMY